MYQKERIDNIITILKTNGYVTVKYLTEKLDYSTATINRDLNIMQKQNLIKRTYGGVELVKKKGIPLPFRYHKMKSEKQKIAHVAANLVCDGDTIFIDGATTTEYMAKFLTEKKDITVITNNINIVTYLSEYGIKTICLGGNIVEVPYLLAGDITVLNASKYNADKVFFSTGGITKDGIISSSTAYDLLHRCMIKNSKKSYYLVDHDKIDVVRSINLFDLNNVSAIITDYKFDNEVKDKYKNTQFIEVKNEWF